MRGSGLTTLASEDEYDTDALNAKDTVTSKAAEIQQKPRWFNVERNWKMLPNQLGQIAVPSTAHSVVTSGESRTYNNIVIRGNRLYDTINHTYDLSSQLNSEGALVCTFIMNLSWDELPPIARTYIAYSARRQFAQDFNLDGTRMQALVREEEEAFLIFETEDKANKKVNIHTDSSSVMSKMIAIGGPNAGSLNNLYFPKRNTE